MKIKSGEIRSSDTGLRSGKKLDCSVIKMLQFIWIAMNKLKSKNLVMQIVISQCVKSVLFGVFFCPNFFRIWTGYGDLLCKSPYSNGIQENVDQKNSKYGYFHAVSSFHRDI